MNNLTIRTTDEEGIDHYRPLFSAQLYTGCKDVHGLGLYVDDIVANDINRRKYIVCFGEYIHGDSAHIGFYAQDTADANSQFPIKQAARWVEIIGNKQDDPELLK